MDLGTIITVAAALLGGGAVKKASKKKGSDAHKLGAPAASALAAILAQAATNGGGFPSQELIARGGEIGVFAVGVHSILKNGKQFLSTGRKLVQDLIALVRELRKLKEKK